MADSLPKIGLLPIGLAVGAGGGYITGKIVGSSPSMWAKICAISVLATHVLYHIATLFTDDLKAKHYIWATINTAGAIASLVALRHFNLIATTGTIVIGSLSAISCLHLFAQAAKF